MIESKEENLHADHIINATSGVVPPMSLPVVNESVRDRELISDECILDVYGEAKDIIIQDRQEASEILNQFLELVMNGGDGSSASKEAVVQLIKAKMDSADKLIKIADLMTRIKLREKDTYPRYLNATQENTINIGEGSAKKELLKRLGIARKKAKKDENEQ